MYVSLGATDLAKSVSQKTSKLSESQKYDYYASLIRKKGKLKTGPNERNIVGIRTITNTNANNKYGLYDDLFALIWKDSYGNKKAREYMGNTEPSAIFRGAIGVDANGDGKLDQGRIPAGFYEYKTGRSDRLGNVLVALKDFYVNRDTNWDGFFNERAMTKGGYTMLFHAGGKTTTGSAGCQTMPSVEFSRFWSDLNENGNPGVVGYTLIEKLPISLFEIGLLSTVAFLAWRRYRG